MQTAVYAGDSITAPGGSFIEMGDAGLYYPYHIAIMRREPDVINLAVGGWGVPEIPDVIFAHPPQPTERYCIFIGTNDRGLRGSSQPAVQFFAQSLAASVAFWTTNKFIVSHSSTQWKLKSAWTTGPVWNGLGMFTQTPGATATVTFSGDVLELVYVLVDAGSAQFSVTIDGRYRGTYSNNPMTTIGVSYTARSYAPALLRITQLGAGQHTLVITKTDGGTFPLWLLWVRDSSNSRTLHLLSLPANLVDPYGVQAYNTQIASVAAQAFSAGLSVYYVDAGKSIVPASDWCKQGVDLHLNNNGHAKYAAALARALDDTIGVSQ